MATLKWLLTIGFLLAASAAGAADNDNSKAPPGVDPAVWQAGLDHLTTKLKQAAKEEDAQKYQKVTIDDLLMRAMTTNRDGSNRDGSILVGKSFDTVGVLTSWPPKKTAAIQGTGAIHDGTGRSTAIAIDLSQLPDPDRARIFDQCSPTPCNARVRVTVVGPASDGFVYLRAEGLP